MTIDRRFSVAEGTAFKAPCLVATTANITLGGLQTIDGVLLAEHDRVLVKNQTDATLNGIYEASTGNWQRTKDFDGARDIVKGTKVFVSSGAHDRIEYTVTSADPIAIGTSAITFSAAGDSILEQAQDAADAAAAYAALLGNQAYTFDTFALAQGATVLAGIQSIRLMGYLVQADGGGGTYKRVVSEPAHHFKVQSADGAWWELDTANGINLRAGGAGLGNASVDTAAMASALTFGTGSGANKEGIEIFLPQGSYTFTTGFLVDHNNTVIRGAGQRLTRILFMPTADATLFTIWNSAATAGVLFTTIKDLFINSTDTAHVKTAIKPINSSHVHLDNLLILGIEDVSKASIGIDYRGREFCLPWRCTVYANNPVVFNLNPDRAGAGNLDTDLWQANECSFVVSPVSPSVLNNIITVNPGVHVTRMSWRDVWIGGGGHGFYFLEDGSGDGASCQDITFDGFYHEQMQGVIYSTIFINFAAAINLLRDVYINRALCALEGGGISIHGLNGSNKMIENVHVDGLEYEGTSDVFSIDNGIKDFSWDNLNVPLDASTYSATGMTLREAGYWRAGACLPSSGSFASDSHGRALWYGAVSSLSRIYGRQDYSVSLGDDESSFLTVFGDYTVAIARITASSGNAGGTALFGAGGALTSMAGTANFAIADTDTKLCVIRASDTSITVKNRLGSGSDVLISVEFSADPTA